MLSLFTFVDIILRSSIKTGLLLWSLSRRAAWEERGEKGGGREIMDKPRLPPSDRTSALQGICINIRQTPGAGETNLQPLYNNSLLKEGLYIAPGLRKNS